MRYVVTLTYETSMVMEWEPGSGSDWELEIALAAEALINQSELSLIDYTAREASPKNTTPAANL